MRSISRTLMAGSAGLIMAASVFAMAPAVAATPDTPTTPAAPAPSPAPTAQAPAITPPVEPPAQAPSAALPATPTTGVAEDPPLATMNAAHDHTMGSTIAEHEPESLAPVVTVPPITAAPAVEKKAAAQPSISPALQATGAQKTVVRAAAGSPAGIPGLDVSGWQVLNAGNWISIAANGARFAYVKATEATDYVSSQFSEQYTDSYNAGLLHGAYHFATPNTSNGATQANWFLNHGGQGSADGRTMPPLLDIEYNPYGATCYGLSAGAMVGWISDFSATIQARTGRLPAIYSTTNWWAQCTGNSAAFGANPLFIARYPNNIADGAGTLPAGWNSYTLWQYASSGIFPGDQDVFNGTLTDLTTYGLSSSVVRTVANASVYLVAGTSKYPVSSMDIMNALSPLGRIAYVPQSYLDQFTTRQTAGRVIRSPDGTISFFDAGMRLPFPSCSLVTDYGGSCDPSGYIQLTAVQFAAFVAGTGMTPLMTSSGGPLYDVAGGARHEVLDIASLTQAGIGAQVNYLTPSALSYLPLGAPIVRDNVYAQQAGTATGVLIIGGTAHSIDPSAAQFVGFPGAAAGSLQAESISKLTTGSPFIGAFRSAADSSVSVLASDGIHPWAQGVGGASFPSVTVPPSFLGTYTLGTAIQAGSAIMSPSNGTVFLVMPNDIRPISSWDALVALSGGKSPSISVVPQALIATLPQGPVALTSGSLVRSTGNATVYLVNGVTNKIPFSTFDPATEAGFTSFSFTTDDRLAAYPTSSSLLGFGVQCGSQKYVSAGGAIHALGSGTSGLYPFSFTSLDSFTCTLAPKGIDATAFIRTPDGSIYYLSNGQKHAITSMTRFAQLSNGQPYLDVVSAFAKAIPTGADA